MTPCQGKISFIKRQKRLKCSENKSSFVNSSLSARWLLKKVGSFSLHTLGNYNSPTGTRADVLKQILVFQLLNYLLLWGLTFHCIQHKINST